jgi:tetratricopeptide (TPR) repeat protein
MKPGRNDPCRCGSGKKFKHCCEANDKSRSQRLSPAEMNQIVGLFRSGRYADLEILTLDLLKRYPDSGHAWMGYGLSLQMQGKDALHALQKTAQLLPEDANAHNNLANTLRERGRLDSAVASCRLALKLDPNLAEAHNNLGLAVMALGHQDQAVASFRHALRIKPDFAEAYSNLGHVLTQLGQTEEALACCRHAVRLRPDFANAYNNLGYALFQFGQLDQAVESYRRAMELMPEFAEAHMNLGIALLELGQLDDAVASFHRSLRSRPDFAEAHINLGNALLDAGRLDEAVKSYLYALRLKPDFPVALSNLGAALRELGQLDDAAERYRRALEIEPKCIEALLGSARLSMEKGDMPEAEALIHKALEINPDDIEARFLLTRANKVKAGDPNLVALAAAADAARSGKIMPGKKEISLNFALGKCFDDIGDHDQAFRYFATGNSLKRSVIRYDPARMTQYFDDIMRVFDRETIARLRGGGDPSGLPVFILGMPRSGTTLTEQILASHPDVYGAGELLDLLDIAQRDITGKNRAFPNNISELDRAGLNAWAADYVAGLSRRAPGVKRITDKMPANFFAVGLIHAMLPNAKIVHVNRNPVDTCLSCYMQLFGQKHEYTYDMAELGKYYVDYSRLMEHWRGVLPAGSFLDVQYEEIIADQETQARRLIDFCGLVWDDACIDFHKNKRSVLTLSLAQVRQPIYKSSVERWRSYERFLGPLLDSLGDLAQQ